MAQVVALIQSDASLLPCQLARLDPVIDLDARAGKVGGLSYFVDGQVLVRKRPLPTPIPLSELAADLRSDSLLAACHSASGGVFQEEDTEPYRFRQWSFAGTGRIVPLGERARVLGELPDFLQRGVRGPSDAELAFFVTLARLHAQHRCLDDADAAPLLAARALAHTLTRLDAAAAQAGAPTPPTAAVLTNGRSLAAIARGKPLWYAVLEGIAACARCQIGPDSDPRDPRVAAHRRLQGVIVATHVRDNGTEAGVHWRRLPDGHALTVARPALVQCHALSDLTASIR